MMSVELRETGSCQIEPSVRTCRFCGMVKPLTAFYFQSQAQVYFRACKACCAVKRRARYYSDLETNRQKSKEAARKLRQQNPEANRKACQKWKETHRDQYNALANEYKKKTDHKHVKEWRAKNQERYNAYQCKWREVNKFKAEDEPAIIEKVESIVPQGLPYEIRDDVCQELMVAVFSREVAVADLRSVLSSYIKRGFREYLNRFGPRSLDSLLDGDEDGRTLADCISIDEVAERLHEAWEANRLMAKNKKSYGGLSAKRERRNPVTASQSGRPRRAR